MWRADSQLRHEQHATGGRFVAVCLHKLKVLRNVEGIEAEDASAVFDSCHWKALPEGKAGKRVGK